MSDRHRVRLEVQFDLQLPSFASVDRVSLYRAAIDQCRWADEHGFDAVNLPEHHVADDGYLPTPLVMAAAVAAVTNKVKIRTALLAPLYDLVRLAEEIAVVDVISDGRLVPVLIPGYRKAEFESLGRSIDERAKGVADAVSVLRQAASGDFFELDGRQARVTPTSPRAGGVPITLGGGGAGTARRAARVADGFRPTTGAAWSIYRQALLDEGRDDPGPWLDRGPIFLHVAEDPETAWEAIGRHVLHSVQQYDIWTRQELGATDASGPSSTYGDSADSVDDLKATTNYRVVTPDDCRKLITALPEGSVVTFQPLMGGIHPDDAWASLELFADQVLPHLDPMQGGAPRPN